MTRRPIRLTKRGHTIATTIGLALTGLALGFFLTLCYEIGSRR